MQDFVTVTGIVLMSAPIGEYDRRVVILTRERGKVPAFAKGARRQNSRLMASTNPFCFGEFKLYAGRSSYNIMEANISNYFEKLRVDFVGAYYGMYFLEIADYYAMENAQNGELLKLVYQSLRALSHPSLNQELVRYIYEMKAMVVEGEFPGIPADRKLDGSTVYAIDYIMNTPVEKLFTFTVTDQVLSELGSVCRAYRQKVFDRNFRSLEILETMVEG